MSRINSDAVFGYVTAIDIMSGFASFGIKWFAHLGYTSFSFWLTPNKKPSIWEILGVILFKLEGRTA